MLDRLLVVIAASIAAMLAAFAGPAQGADFDPVLPGRAISLPADSGSHPGHRLEWWYVTGQLDSPKGPLGFQVTFFRVRNPGAEGGASRFAPSQLLFAHAALAQPAHGKLRHDQRSSRAGFELAEARVGKLDVFIEDWSLVQVGEVIRARIASTDFALELDLRPTQAPLLQGENGFSRKGPDARHASYYYSQPHLAVSGKVSIGRESVAVTGTAWLDHEWSSELLAANAVGWDWFGANLEGGASLMAFRIRAVDGSTLWASAASRPREGPARHFAAHEVRFNPRRQWKSPRTGTQYPVAMDVMVGETTWQLDPLMDDQELDARASTGTLYWEGAVRVTGSRGERGQGYLELAGYKERLPF